MITIIGIQINMMYESIVLELKSMELLKSIFRVYWIFKMASALFVELQTQPALIITMKLDKFVVCSAKIVILRLV